jgi:hypothetical protein
VLVSFGHFETVRRDLLRPRGNLSGEPYLLAVLLSTEYRFVFIATLKTASTAIEAALSPHACIHIGHTRFGKHMSLTDAVSRFGFIFDEVPFEEFESFAVVREPAERLHSLYRSHKDGWFRKYKPERWTGEMSFDQFLEDWLIRHPRQSISQTEQLTDQHGTYKLSNIYSFERMPDEFPSLVKRLVPDAKIEGLPKRNASETEEEITEAERRSVYELYPEDLALYKAVKAREQYV